MTIRVRLSGERRCTVHEQPSWLARFFLRRTERDYEAWRVRAPGGRLFWVTHDNREVSRRVEAAIACASGHQQGRR